MSTISVIMVSYYTGPALWLAMESVLRQRECAELHLVNNGNIPGDEKRLQQWAAREPRLKLHSGQGNIGFARACNLGAKAATGKYVMLLNPDSMISDGGLARALAIIEAYPEHTLAGPYLLNPDGSEQRGGRRALLTPENGVAESLGLDRFSPKFKRVNYNETPMPATTHEVPAISGACMLISRAFYMQMGGMDAGYFLHMEDMDFCYRVHKAGGKIICMPEVKVLHFRSTSEVTSSFIEKQKAKGFIRYIETHFAKQYSPLAIAAMRWGIWLRYAAKVVVGQVDSWLVPPLAGKREIARLVLLYKLSGEANAVQTLAGKTILVTGASSQIGLSVIGKALAQGAKVIAFYHKKQIAFAHPRLQWMQVDLTTLRLEPGSINADILIYTAGLWLLPKLLPSLPNTGIKRVIAFSSTSVQGKTDSRNAYEQEVVEKLLAAENENTRLCAELGCALTLLRPTMVYGVGLDANLTRMADVIRRFGVLAIYPPAQGKRHPVQALDLADAALGIIGNAATYGKTYSLGGPQAFTYRNMVEMVFAYLGKRPRILAIPFLPPVLNILGKLYQMPNINGEIALRMNRDLAFDNAPAAQDFGYRPQGFLEGDVTL